MYGGPRHSFSERMIGAALLKPEIYEEVEADAGATGQAAGAVAIVAVAMAIGAWRVGGGGVVMALVSAFVGWGLWSGITYYVGTKLFDGTADYGEMLRTIGFAQSPGVLGVLGVVPLLGWLVRLVVGLWMLAAAIIAIRQALDFGTGRAVLTALVGWVVYVVLSIVLGMLTGGAFA